MAEPRKPSESEEEYFARLELERRKQWAKEREAQMEQEEKQRLKDLHYMKCPKCGMDLTSFELHDLSLDRCVSCGGTWFDAGEVEELLEKEQGIGKRLLSIFK
ncbi:MAG TPA: zf-TFIIB domain-containing protein [Thermoanaerobaculia bacterium]|nr:zf-TFIIB domain-containing protein [Thermoanaerobaculia bacterium]